jgi:hemerythrin superfamily protein
MEVSVMNLIKIQTVSDLKNIFSLMHDSEFTENDFNFDEEKHLFQISTVSSKMKYSIELYNVVGCKFFNLENITKGKATGGIFNYVKIENKGHNLMIISQDLRISLRLASIRGEFKEESV